MARKALRTSAAGRVGEMERAVRSCVNWSLVLGDVRGLGCRPGPLEKRMARFIMRF